MGIRKEEGKVIIIEWMQLLDTNCGFNGEAIRLILYHSNTAFEDAVFSVKGLELDERLADSLLRLPQLAIPNQKPLEGLKASLIALGRRLDRVPLFDDSERCLDLLNLIETAGVHLTKSILANSINQDCASELRAIFVAANNYLTRNVIGKHAYCFGEQLSIADFGVLGLYFAACDYEQLRPLVESALTPDLTFLLKLIENGRKIFFKHFLKTGRHIIYGAESADMQVAKLVMRHAKIPMVFKPEQGDAVWIAGKIYPQLELALHMILPTLGYLPIDKGADITNIIKAKQIARDIMVVPVASRDYPFIGDRLAILNKLYENVPEYSKLVQPPLCNMGDFYVLALVEQLEASPIGKQTIEDNAPAVYGFYKRWMQRHSRREQCLVLSVQKEEVKASPPTSLPEGFPMGLMSHLFNLGYSKVQSKRHSVAQQSSTELWPKECDVLFDINEDCEGLCLDNWLSAGCTREFWQYSHNKYRMVQLLDSAHCPLPKHTLVSSSSPLPTAPFPLPLSIYMADGCCKKATTQEELTENMKPVLQPIDNSERSAIIESHIEGIEYVALVIGNHSSLVEVLPPCKWTVSESNETEVIKIQQQALADQITNMAKQVYTALKGTGYAVVRFVRERDNSALLVRDIEAIPRITYSSYVTLILLELNIRIEELLDAILFMQRQA